MECQFLDVRTRDERQTYEIFLLFLALLLLFSIGGLRLLLVLGLRVLGRHWYRQRRVGHRYLR